MVRAVMVDRDIDISTNTSFRYITDSNFGVSIQFRHTHTLIRNWNSLCIYRYRYCENRKTFWLGPTARICDGVGPSDGLFPRQDVKKNQLNWFPWWIKRVIAFVILSLLYIMFLIVLRYIGSLMKWLLIKAHPSYLAVFGMLNMEFN